MRFGKLKVIEIKVFNRYFWIKLKGVKERSKPGQFYMLKGDWDTPLLLRPFSVLWEDEKGIEFLIKIVGEGTKRLSKLSEGDEVIALGPLGNGFLVDNSLKEEKILLVGGGIGIPPIYYLLKKLNDIGMKPILYFGAKGRDELFLIDEIKKCNVELKIATEDGSLGKKGLVVDLIDFNEYFDLAFSCGPYKMLLNLNERLRGRCKKHYVSLEERMGCGYGVCLGCAVKVKTSNGNFNYVRVCKEGPVFDSEIILWE